jgi:hypothetical protein
MYIQRIMRENFDASPLLSHSPLSVTCHHSICNIHCCIYGPISLAYGLWASAGLMHNLLKMMVVADSAGDAS